MTLDFGKEFEVECLHRTFKNLRDVYVRKRKEYREALRRTSGADAGVLEKYTSWPYYKALMFLEHSTDSGQRYCNVISEDLLEEDIDVVEEESNGNKGAQGVGGIGAVSVVRPVSALGQKRAKRTSRQKAAMEELTSALISHCGNPDKYDAMGQLLSMKLREMAAMSPMAAEQWSLKFEEYQIQLFRAILEIKGKNGS
ncbi:hypothetical protein ANCCAN_24801 [Ancylostoma caninum]|uniref:MADF domain-containing protein n=1 Tax=Ancylostoma caninum TaxID=29170 RepID=A0A368FCU9_ANCCA|nr:hypothetical protein ANCCAN_24801 [Ancylostoma caninum]